MDSPVGTLPKSCARNNMDSNVTKLEETLLLVSSMLEESQKSFQIQQDETNKLTKQVDQLQGELSQMKVRFEEIKCSVFIRILITSSVDKWALLSFIG